MPDLTEIRLDVKTVVAIVMTVVTGAGVFYGVKAKLDDQAATIAALRAQITAMQAQQEEDGHRLLELTVTLRARGVITP